MAANQYERFRMPQQFTTMEEALNWGWGAAFCFIILESTGHPLPGYSAKKFQELNIQALSRPKEGDSNYEASLLVSNAWVRQALSLLNGFKDKMGSEEEGLESWKSVVFQAAGIPSIQELNSQLLQKKTLLGEFVKRTWALREDIGLITDEQKQELAVYFLPVWHSEESVNFTQADHFARQINELVNMT
jgi:hypothetical protein